MKLSIKNFIANIKIPKAVIEFLVILLSILIAFSLDSWGENRKQRARENQYLSQLDIDFKENMRQLMGSIEKGINKIEKTEKILDLLKLDPRPSHVDSLKKWIPYITNYSINIPITGTYEAMISSGDINLITNDSIRTQLIHFAGLIDELKTHEQRFMDWMIDLFNSAAADEFFTADMLLKGRDNSGQIVWPDLLTSRNFHRLVSRLHIVSINLLAFQKMLIMDVEDLKNKLDKEIGVPPAPVNLDTDYIQGKYKLSDNLFIIIYKDKTQLKARVTGQTALNIYPESKTLFYYAAINAKIQFILDDSGKAISLVVVQNGRKNTAQRVAQKKEN